MNKLFGFTYHLSMYGVTLIYGVFILMTGLISDKFRDWAYAKTSKSVSRLLLLSAGVKLSWSGRDVIKQLGDRSYIVVVNHVTTLDVPVLMIGLDKHDLSYVYSRYVVCNIPFIGKLVDAAFRAAGWVSIKGDDDSSSALKLLISSARSKTREQGRAHLVIFPEGARSADGSISDFHDGAFYLSLLLGYPIVPVLNHGVFAVHHYKRFSVNPGRIHVEIKEPIEPPKVGRGELRQKAAELRRKVNQIYKDVPNLNLAYEAPGLSETKS